MKSWIMFSGAAALLLTLGSTFTQARDWEDYWEERRERLEELREKRREAYEDWREEMRDRRRDLYRAQRRGWYPPRHQPWGAPYRYYGAPRYPYGAPSWYGGYRPGSYLHYAPGRGFSIQTPYFGFSIGR